MTLIETRYEHIGLDEHGIPRIGGTSLKVIDLVEAKAANNWTPEELSEQHPELTPGEIYSALAYYWDHKAELDADMARREREVEQLRQAAPPSPFVERMRREGRL